MDSRLLRHESNTYQVELITRDGNNDQIPWVELGQLDQGAILLRGSTERSHIHNDNGIVLMFGQSKGATGEKWQLIVIYRGAIGGIIARDAGIRVIESILGLESIKWIGCGVKRRWIISGRERGTIAACGGGSQGGIGPIQLDHLS